MSVLTRLADLPPWDGGGLSGSRSTWEEVRSSFRLVGVPGIPDPESARMKVCTRKSSTEFAGRRGGGGGTLWEL